MNANFFTTCQKNFAAEKTCIVDAITKRAFSYSDLEKNTAAKANWLLDLKLQTGDRVILQTEKSVENLFWYFACLRAGLVFLPLNTAYQPDELQYFVDNAEPSLIIADPASVSIFDSFASCRIESLDADGNFSQEIPPTEHFSDVHVSEQDIAVIIYTSGTTGKPKGAMISHGNLTANAQALTKKWAWQKEDVILHALPIFHVHGLFVASHLPIVNGSTILFLDKFSPEKVIEHLPDATVYMGVPTNYTRLLKHPEFNRHSCRNMRLFTSGSAPLLAQTFSQMAAQTNHDIVERYGMTETGMNTSNPIGRTKPGTVGPPLDGVEVKIVDDSGAAVEPGQPGHLLVRGANVFKGYWRMPEKTAEEFTDDQFFRTGDIATQDEDAYVSIVGRSKDLIITGGLNVYPKEIESVIDKIDGVLESAVIGLPDADFGEAVTAVVVKRDDNLVEADIQNALQGLAKFKRPKHIYFVDELPRNTMSKVQKNSLRSQFTAN